MKRKPFVVIASIILIVALLGSTVLFTFGARLKDGDYYALDEELFKDARIDDNTVFLAYTKGGDLCTVWESSSLTGHEWLPLEDMGNYIKDGFISAEDREFYSHRGVNVRRTLAAMVNYVTRIRPGFGASTITQQVVKNISGDNEYSVSRKFNEIMRAIHLERIYTKDEILEVYLNIVPMSGNMSGVMTAAQNYFGRSPSELTLAQAATIVGITNSPSRYDPERHPEECVEKRNRVLYAMLDNGAITQEQYDDAVKEPLKLAESGTDRAVSSWFVETATADVLKDLSLKYEISNAAAKVLLRGAKVVLTVNTDVQSLLENYFENTDNFPKEIESGLNYAMTVIDNKTGDLIATVGGVGRKRGNRLLNLAEITVPPASALKPLAIYAPMIEADMICWSTVVDDTPVKTYERDGKTVGYPVNSPNVYSGLTTVYDALRVSKNTVAVKLLDRFGAERAFRELKERYGFDLVRSRKNADGRTVTDLDVSPLALGQLTDGVTVRELTSAYSAFPREGIISSPRSYVGVFANDGHVLLENRINDRRIYKQSTCRIMNQMLMGVVTDGTASSVKLKYTLDVAGKTGTSSGNYDRLFVGYTPYFTAGIWCGYPDRSSGVVGVSPSQVKIWDAVMKEIHEKTVVTGYGETTGAFSTQGLEYRAFCADSGELPTDACMCDPRGDRIHYGYFAEGTAPVGECGIHEWQLATDELYPESGLNIQRDLPDEIEILDNGYIIRKEDYSHGFDNSLP